MFEQEKEKAKWILERDHIIGLRDELQETINKLEKKKDSLLRENEKLKNDCRMSKRINNNNNITGLATNVLLNLAKNA